MVMIVWYLTNRLVEENEGEVEAKRDLETWDRLKGKENIWQVTRLTASGLMKLTRQTYATYQIFDLTTMATWQNILNYVDLVLVQVGKPEPTFRAGELLEFKI